MIRLFVILIVVISANAWAKSQVVFDSGRTVPLSKYTNNEPVVKKPLKEYTVEQIQQDVNNLFPIEAQIPLGVVKPYLLTADLKSLTSRPVALVGTGKTSQQWLNFRLSELRDINATVIVIDAESYTIFSKFEHALMKAGLQTIFASSEPFVGIAKGYPVIISDGRVYQ